MKCFFFLRQKYFSIVQRGEPCMQDISTSNWTFKWWRVRVGISCALSSLFHLDVWRNGALQCVHSFHVFSPISTFCMKAAHSFIHEAPGHFAVITGEQIMNSIVQRVLESNVRPTEAWIKLDNDSNTAAHLQKNSWKWSSENPKLKLIERLR